jgi:DNA polymerase-4
LAIARRLCPQLLVITPRFEAYAQASKQAFSIFSHYTPQIEALALDEAFLDVGGSLSMFGSARRIGEAIRSRVRSEIGLTCSVGIASSKLVAKLATESAKPDGLAQVAAGAEADFLAPLPIADLWGVGRKTAEKLKAQGISTIGQLATASAESLWPALGRQSQVMRELARGIDLRGVVAQGQRLRMSYEHTFEHDVEDVRVLERQILVQAERLADRLMKSDGHGHSVHLKLRDHRFQTQTRQVTQSTPFVDTRAIFAVGRQLLHETMRPGHRYRLIGLGIGAFDHDSTSHEMPEHDGQGGQQLSLFTDDAAASPGAEDAQSGTTLDPSAEALAAVQRVKSAIRERFGVNALRLAAGVGGDKIEEEHAKRSPGSGPSIRLKDR